MRTLPFQRILPLSLPPGLSAYTRTCFHSPVNRRPDRLLTRYGEYAWAREALEPRNPSALMQRRQGPGWSSMLDQTCARLCSRRLDGAAVSRAPVGIRAYHPTFRGFRQGMTRAAAPQNA